MHPSECRQVGARDIVHVGTKEFAFDPKIVNGVIIDKGAIHYREYRRKELTEMLLASGFDVAVYDFIAMGSPRNEPLVKRLIKSAPAVGVCGSLEPAIT